MTKWEEYCIQVDRFNRAMPGSTMERAWLAEMENLELSLSLDPEFRHLSFANMRAKATKQS